MSTNLQADPLAITEDDFLQVLPTDMLARLHGYSSVAAMQAGLGMAIPEGPITAALLFQIDEKYQEIFAPAIGTCATVALQLGQDVVQTRDAFAATMELTNATNASLESVGLDIQITDEHGNPANDLFAIQLPTLTNLTAIDGTGTLVGGTGTVKWIIIPTSEAASQQATTYHVGGTLKYLDGNILVTIPLTPVEITVYPQPELDLKYFWQRDVFSDDPYTDAVEPAEPFQLAVMVENKGAGAARNLRIDSAQPKIVDNEKGLLIDFQLIGTEVAGQNMTPTLTADFGELAPGEIKIGTWWMTSTLQGHFIDYKASFMHVDALGDNRLSLIKNVEIHELVHRVDAAGDFEDDRPDFLVNDIPDIDDLPDTLYLSDGRVMNVSLGLNPTVDGTLSGDNYQVELSADLSQGWNYLRLKDGDPGGDHFRLTRVVRSDGVELPVGDFWQTDRTFIDGGQPPIYENDLHLFEYVERDGHYSYTLYYAPRDTVAPTASLESVGSDPQTTPISQVDVTFSKAIDPASFTWQALSLTRNGQPIPLTAAITITPGPGNSYHVSGLTAFDSEDGQYALTLDTSRIRDFYGNSGRGVAFTTWTMAASSPAILLLSGPSSALCNTPLDVIEVVFSKPIKPSTFSAANLTLTLDGENVTLSSPLSIQPSGPQSYQVSGLAAATAADGSYCLTVSAASVEDLEGDFGVGQRMLTWTMDATGPALVSLSGVSTPTASKAVDGLVVQFSEDVDPASFAAASLTLTRNGGPNLITSEISLQPIDGKSYRILGLADLDSTDGQYVLTVSAAMVRDLAGNLGHGGDSLTWIMDTVPPAPPANLAITPDTGVSASDAVTNSGSVIFSGDLSETGLHMSVFDAATGTDVGQGTVTGTHFSQAITFTAPGRHVLHVTVSDDAGNSSLASYTVFLDLTNPLVSTVTVPVNAADGPNCAILVTFSEAMNFESLLADGSITSAVCLTSHTTGVIPLMAGQFSCDASAHTLTISLLSSMDSLHEGIYDLSLDGNKLTDRAGNLLRGGTASTVAIGVPSFAAAQLVQAAGMNLQVAGYSAPTMADWNGDGLADLIVGEKTGDNTGKVRIYLNTGTTAAPAFGAFRYAQSNGADLSVPASGSGCLGAFPQVYDCNKDGKKDLLVGQADGRIALFTNVGTPDNPQFDAGSYLEVGQPGAKGQINVGARATLTIIDWNDDGRDDLLVGSLDGRVRVFLDCAGSGPADFRDSITVQDGSADLTVPSGRSSISVFDLNGDGRKDLVLGNTEGQVIFYANTGTDAVPVFQGYRTVSADGIAIDLPGAARSRLCVTDFNADGVADLLVGSADGSVRLYEGESTFSVTESAVRTDDAPGTSFVHTFAMDLTPPIVSILPLTTNKPSPALAGTVEDSSAVVRISVAGGIFFALNNHDGTWTLPAGTIAPALRDGRYDVVVTATDSAANVGVDSTTNELLVDTESPTSSVAVLPATSEASFMVSWTGQDSQGGAGIREFDVFVSDNGGVFHSWLIDTTATSACYQGQRGHTYSFYSLAADNAGNHETKSPAAEATTTIPSEASSTITNLTTDHPTGSVYGQSVTFTATVTTSDPQAGIPTGFVQFVIDGANFGSAVTVNGGTASIVVSTLTAGSHLIEAFYTSNDTTAFQDSHGSRSADVARAPLSVLVDSKSKIYGQDNPQLTGTISGLVNGDSVGAYYTTTASNFSDVGNYDITVLTLVENQVEGTPDTLSNYAVSITNGTLTITKADQTITWDRLLPIFYGTAFSAAQLNATVTGVAGGSAPGGLTYDPHPAIGTVLDVGQYVLSVTAAATKNYNTATQTSTLLVSPSPIHIKIDDQHKIYGQDNPTLTGKLTGVFDRDNITVSFSTTAEKFSDAGTYWITYTANDPDGRMGNYMLYSDELWPHGTLTITKADQTITWATPAAVTYGTALSASQLNATVAGVTGGSAPGTLTYDLAAGTVLNAGVHRLSVAADATKNYNAATATVCLDVTPATLTIRADNKSQVYGSALPTLTASYTGWVNGDTPACLTCLPALSTTATGASHVADYTITVSGAASPNYTISYLPGTLTVTPAPLTIKADNKTMLFGDPLPTLTASYSGLVNGDTATSLATLPTLSTAATANSPVGTYAIDVSGAFSPDYTITQLAGTLTVAYPENVANLTADPLNPRKTLLSVYGTSGNDVIEVMRGRRTGDVSVSINGTSKGTFHPTGRIVVHGLAGNDLIQVSNRVTTATWLHGDEGNDMLWGGGGPTLLMGEAGNDSLNAGKGRSILIGGNDADVLRGGHGDTVLIGGTTDHDANDHALLTLLDEWSSSSNYATRVNHLTGRAGGKNSSCFLNANTVHDDAVRDLIYGSSGMDLFFQSPLDTIFGKQRKERLISIR